MTARRPVDIMSDAPNTIHRYDIVERIGQGGMGELYLARDPALERFVAIKVLRAGFDSDEVRARFTREARAVARLAHINIVTIYDVGEHEGRPFIAMEYIPGETLFQKIRARTRLPLATKLQYIDELCAGLAHAHRAGIIHRDIKPANLIVGPEGALKILDFGIARVADSSMTQSGMMIGTLNYMSPEQVTGQEVVGQRSDIFAVGAVCYELLCYQQAFPGGIDSGVLHRIISGTPPPLDQVCPGLDSSLVALVNRALAKAPADRFEDLVAMRSELVHVRDRLDRAVLASTLTGLRTRKIPQVATPASTPRTPRRGLSREDLQRRRAEQLAGDINLARAALDAGRFEEASAACERVLIVTENHEEALEISEKARQGIERNQIREWMYEADADLSRGDLSAARQVLSQILALADDSAEAAALQSAIEKAQARWRADEAVAGGRAYLDRGDAPAAAAAAREALSAQPAHTAAAALLRDAELVVEELRRKAEHDRRAGEAIANARRGFAAGDLDDAIALLDEFSPSHPDVDRALAALRIEAHEIRERELARTRQVVAELATARAYLSDDDLHAAVAAVGRARVLAPDHAEVLAVADAIEKRRVELIAKRRAEEEAQRQSAEEAQREEEARRKAAEKARQEAAEAEQRRAWEEIKQREEERRRQAAEEAKQRADAQARRQAEEQARQRAEEEEERRKADDEARRAAEQARWKLAQEEARRKAAERVRQRAEEEARKKSDDEVRARTQAAEQFPSAENWQALDREGLRPSAMASAPTIVDIEQPPSATVVIATGPPAPVPLLSRPAAPTKGGGARQVLPLAAAVIIAVALVGFSVWTLTSGDRRWEGTAPVTAAGAREPSGPATTVPPAPPARVETGTLLIDAAPWAEIVEIVGAAGPVAPIAGHTPMAFAVPAGDYRITLRNPSDAQPRVVSARVEAGGSTRAFAEFKPVDVADYFRRAGS